MKASYSVDSLVSNTTMALQKKLHVISPAM